MPRLLATGCGNTAGNASSARDEIVNLRLVKQMVNALFGGFRQNRCRPSSCIVREFYQHLYSVSVVRIKP